MKWPGQANLEVSLVTINKRVTCKKYLNGHLVNSINSFLSDDLDIGIPACLLQNMQKCFAGSTVLGKGFILENDKAETIINACRQDGDVILPYLIGDDLNNKPDQNPSRHVINFFDWTEEKAKLYSVPYNILLENVKDVRLKDNRKTYRDRWWIFAERRVDLYNKLPASEVVIAVCRVTKYLSFSFVPKGIVYDVGTNVILSNSKSFYTLLQTSLHEIWARKYGSSLETRLRYTNEDCFENFPFPLNISKVRHTTLEQVGEQYHENRRKLMLAMSLGLTKTYNAFHTKEIHDTGITTQGLKDLDKKTIEKQFGKEVWNLWNHLQKTPGSCSIEEAITGIIKLRELHVEMDNAVLAAYGWQDVQLMHDFYEVDYLPENDRVRYTIHPEVRKEILKRLLELNHKIHEEEVAAGLWDKKKPKEYKTKTTKSSKAEESGKGYRNLFTQ